MSTRRILLWGSFIVFLVPVLVGAVSVNYGYLLVPVLMTLIDGRVHRPPDDLQVIMGVYLAIFVVALLYQSEWTTESVRRLVSFAVFMAVFTFTLVRVDPEMVAAFKGAIVAISVVFSLQSIYLLTRLGASIGYAAKDLVGSQRYGFVYLLAFWLVTCRDGQVRLPALMRYAVLLVLLAGLLLTFSRSSIVALLIPAALFVASGHRRWRRRPSLKGALRVVWSLAATAVAVAALNHVVPITFEFFGERLFSFLANSDAVANHLSDATTSEGTRVLIASKIVEFVLHNPVTGAGYLGVWILPEARAGSAHNQYMDTLFRTGMVGLVAYGYLLVRLLRLLFERERGLFWGLVSMMVYGMFHETFKESQGSFIFAFLLGMLAQSIRNQHQAGNATAVSRPHLAAQAGPHS